MAHPHLQRQLRRLGLDADHPPDAEAWRAMLERVERTYEDADRDRYTLERSLAISSAEMQRLYDLELAASHRELSANRRELHVAAAVASATMEAAPYGIACVGADQRLVAANAMFSAMWDLPAEAVEGGSIDELIGIVAERVSLPDELLARVAHLHRHPQESSREEISLRDGRSFDCHTEPLISKAGVHLGRVWYFQDVTHQRRVQATLARRVVERTHELRVAEDHLRSARKVETVGRLAGGVAHDFNNILAVVLSFAEMLLETVDDEAARADLAQIRTAALRGADLTQQLLAFSRQQVLRAEHVDLNGVIAEMERMLTRLIGEDVRYEARLQRAVPPVVADPGQVHQVLMNLVVNARDAMPRGGALRIGTSVVDVSEHETAGDEPVPPGRYVALTVEDTGVGMDESVLERIFEPFFTTKPRGRGTGLGLSTVFGIVRQSGGHIAVESTVGRGTTVSVRFPAAAARAGQRAATEPPPSVGSETVLLVEDEHAVREAARRILQRGGYRVIEASSGREALDVIEAGLCSVDLVLTDVVMPGMSGADLAAALRERHPSLRVLFMSGYTEHALLADSAIRPQSLLQKPFAPRILLSRVRSALEAA